MLYRCSSQFCKDLLRHILLSLLLGVGGMGGSPSIVMVSIPYMESCLGEDDQPPNPTESTRIPRIRSPARSRACTRTTWDFGTFGFGWWKVWEPTGSLISTSTFQSGCRPETLRDGELTPKLEGPGRGPQTFHF